MNPSVLGMYSTPSHPLYRDLGSGLLTSEALKIAGAKAERKSKLGWALIMLTIGDSGAGKTLIHCLNDQGYKSNEILAVLKVLVPDHLCRKCNGTGQAYSETGRRWINCKSCDGSGRRKIRLDKIIRETGTEKARLEEMITYCLQHRSDAEKEIAQFLAKERDANFV